MIFWRPSISKDLLGRKFQKNDFYPHRGAPFWKNFSKFEKMVILTPLKNDVPSPIEQWSVTKKNQVMSWNYQIIWSSEVLRLWRKKNWKIKKKLNFRAKSWIKEFSSNFHAKNSKWLDLSLKTWFWFSRQKCKDVK